MVMIVFIKLQLLDVDGVHFNGVELAQLFGDPAHLEKTPQIGDPAIDQHGADDHKDDVRQEQGTAENEHAEDGGHQREHQHHPPAGIAHPVQVNGPLQVEQGVNDDIDAQHNRENGQDDVRPDEEHQAYAGSHDAQKQLQPEGACRLSWTKKLMMVMTP